MSRVKKERLSTEYRVPETDNELYKLWESLGINHEQINVFHPSSLLISDIYMKHRSAEEVELFKQATTALAEEIKESPKLLLLLSYIRGKHSFDNLFSGDDMPKLPALQTLNENMREANVHLKYRCEALEVLAEKSINFETIEEINSIFPILKDCGGSLSGIIINFACKGKNEIQEAFASAKEVETDMMSFVNRIAFCIEYYDQETAKLALRNLDYLGKVLPEDKPSNKIGISENHGLSLLGCAEHYANKGIDLALTAQSRQSAIAASTPSEKKPDIEISTLNH